MSQSALVLDHWTIWTGAIVAAFCIGLSKAGFSGVSMVSVVVLAQLFGAKESVGIALPMLIFADIVVYPAFRKYGSWKLVWPLLFPMVVGVLIGVRLLDEIDNQVAKPLIGSLILVMLLLTFLKRRFSLTFERLAHSVYFGYGAGVFGGVSTALANAAGPVIQLFLLSRDHPKMEMIGIGARLFLLINVIKLPMLGAIDLVNRESFFLNLVLCPVILVGVICGKTFLKKIPQKAFERLVVIFAAIAATNLLLGLFKTGV